ncbi:MAG: RNA methyltransferase [Bacillota bacterium]|nr:RNA methyltransferase [Bacillota bacterium]
MKRITSAQNNIYKSALRLTRKKYRDAEGKYILEGIKPLKDAVKQGIEIESIFFREGIENGLGIISDTANLIELEGSLFDEISDTENSQGVLAVVKKKLQDYFGFTGPGSLVLLDRLQDPGNIGTIIRTAEAAGCAGILAIKGTGDVYSPKVVRSAAGSMFRMPIAEGLETSEAVEICRKAGKKIAVSCLEGATDYRDADLDENTAIVIGNEGRGVSEELMELADVKVKIPMTGEIESLNAAVAAGILLYQAARKVR